MELIGSHGWNFGVEGSSFEEWATFGVAAAWFWAAMYRLGFFLAGHFEGPQRLLFLLPGCESTVIIPLEESLRWWFWVLAALLLGLLHPAEAWEPTVVAPFLDSEEVSPHCPALAPVRAEPERDIENRHIPPNEDLGPMPRGVQLLRAVERGESGTDSTSTPWTSDEETAESPVESGTREPAGYGRGPSYRATDGALLVIHEDNELVVPLPGWSLEEVWSIVLSIQQNDWTPFHDMMGIVGMHEGVTTTPVPPEM